MASGSFNLTCSNTRVTVWCNWWEQNTNIENNTSEIAVNVFLRRANNGYTTSGTINTTVTAGTASQSENGLRFSNNGTSDTLIFAKVYSITHESDGSKGLTLSVSYNGDVISGSGSSAIALDQIPRTSQITIAKSEFNVGEDVIIYTNQKSGAFTHSLYIQRADGLFYAPVIEGIVGSCNINIPAINDIIYYEARNSAYYNSCFLLRTLSGETEIGDSTVTFKANIVNSNPTIESVSYTVINQSTQNPEIVQYNSDIDVNFSGVSAKNQASIVSYNVLCGGNRYTSATSTVRIENIPDATLSCWVTDSRGFDSQQESITLEGYYPYSSPIISNLKAVRVNDIEENVNVSFKINISEIAVLKSGNHVYYSYKQAASAGDFCEPIELIEPTATETEVTLSLMQTFAIDQNFILKFTADDFYSSSDPTEILLQTALPELSIRKDSIGINCIPVEGEGVLQINGKNFLNMVYPIGSVYMSVNSTDPSALFEGTSWMRIAKGRALFGADDNASEFAAGATGGSYVHSHGRGNLCAAIGSCDDSPISLGFIASNELNVRGYGNATYKVNGSSYDSQRLFNHFTSVFGTTSDTSTLPAYMCVYIWQRTA